MKGHKFQLLIIVVVMLAVSLACGGSFSTAKIFSAKMTADSEGTKETTVFSQDQTFYCIVNLANAPEDTKLKAVWTAVEVEGEQPNLLIDQAEMTSGNQNVFTFNLTNNQLWPTGKYKVDLYLNDKLDRTLEFTVE
jgi:flagellar basal body-associated protein FliL